MHFKHALAYRFKPTQTDTLSISGCVMLIDRALACNRDTISLSWVRRFTAPSLRKCYYRNHIYGLLRGEVNELPVNR